MTAPRRARRPAAAGGAGSAVPAAPAAPGRLEITRGDRPAYVYEQLRELIVRGVLGPGARLVEMEIAKRFGVSRTPVTLALKRLEQEGYVVGANTPHSRASVAPLTRGDARELFRIVGELEGIAGEMAAALPDTPRRALARELKELNTELRRASEERRHADPRLNELDERFHRRFVEAGAGPRLLALHDRIKPQVKRYTRIYVTMLPSEVPLSVAEHEGIVRAVRAGDQTAALEAIHTNWRRAGERLARLIDTMGERSGW
ncbi:MAG: GntR family transcriptional regulator [Gemmatimonadaceae bacterium]